ncbi:hypothetical protein H0O00_00455 [Candidatus Micrarchaeota archaeon]|nr:hypothetical protein [Candidatus Micrarchaeota archaeon]
MKKTEYSFVQEAEDVLHTLDASKHDDYDLPEFSKEVPAASRKHESGDTVTVEYDWKESKNESIRVKRIDFRKGEDLDGLYRVAARDGADSICFKHNNNTYIIRKTVREIAQALYNAYGKIKGAIESVIGYIRTVLGHEYVLAKVEGPAWAFDKRISKESVTYVDVDNLDRKSKSKLCEMVAERISELHATNVIIGRFTLNNILLGNNDVRFTDLRKLRVSRKRSFVIDEFKSILQYLFAIGVASREDVYCAIAYYAAQNEDGCEEWYQDKTGKKAADQLDIASRIEQEIYS